MMGRPQRSGARGVRKMALSLLDLRVVLLCMCVLSFVLTFLYVDDFDTRASSDGRVTHQVEERQRLVHEMQGDSVGAIDPEELENEHQTPMGEEEEELLMEADEEDEAVMEPEVLTIQPFHGPALGGMLLTIHGHNLKSSHGFSQPEVLVGGVPCNDTSVVDQEELTCVTPPGVGGRLSVRVTLRNQSPGKRGVNGERMAASLSSKDNTLFSYDEPIVHACEPDHGRTSGDSTITVLGANFGNVGDARGALRVFINGVACAHSRRVSDTLAVCVTPPGPAGAQGVVVTVGDGEHEVESTAATAFAFVMTPAERLLAEAATLLDGLTVRYPPSAVSVVMHVGGLNAPPTPHHSRKHTEEPPPYEHPHQDLFTGERSVYAVPPELMAVLPETDVDRSHVSCAIVGNSAYLLDQEYGADIDGASAVLRFNNAPTAGFERHVGGRTDFRLVEPRFLRSLLSRDPYERRKAWRPSAHESMLVWSPYAQDLYVQVCRVFQRLPILYVSRDLATNTRALYGELRRRFADLRVTASLRMNLQQQAEQALGPHDAAVQQQQQQQRRRRRLHFTAQHVAETEPMEVAHNVMPLAGPTDPPASFIAVALALQMCESIRMYGFEPFDPATPETAAGGGAEQVDEWSSDRNATAASGDGEGAASLTRRGPYYVREGIDGVYDAGEDDASDEESRSVDAAIIELLRLRKFVQVFN